MRYFSTRLLPLLLFMAQLTANGQPAVLLHKGAEQPERFSPGDTVQINRLIDLGRDSFSHRPDTALQILETAKTRSISSGYADGIALALILQSRFYRSINDRERYAGAIAHADWYIRNGAFHDKDRVLRMWYYYKAKALIDEMQYDSSLHYLHRAERLAVKTGNTSFLYAVNTQIADLWIKAGEPEKALHYIRKLELIIAPLSPAEKTKDYIGDIIVLYTKAYNDLDDTAALYRSALKALRTGRANGSKRLQAMGHIILISYYSMRKQPDKILLHAAEALQRCDTGDYDYMCGAYWGLSLGHYHRQDLVKAKEYGLRALDYSQRQIGFASSRVSLYRHLSKVHFLLADTGQAFLFQLQYAQLSDSLNQIARHKAVNKIEVQYRIAEKDRTLARQQLELSRKENGLRTSRILLISGSIVTILLLVSLLLLRRNARSKQQRLSQEAAIRQLEAAIESEQKERSRIAMELHDGIISALTAVKLNLDVTRPAPGYAALYSQSLAQLEAAILDVRNTAHNLMPEILVRNHTDKAVEMLCALISKTGKLDVRYLAYGDFTEIDPETGLAIYRIVQELLHNIITHAGADKALVQLSCHERLLFIAVEDNGRGMDRHRRAKHSGTGLKNITERVRALNGQIRFGESGFGEGLGVHIEFDYFYILTRNTQK